MTDYLRVRIEALQNECKRLNDRCDYLEAELEVLRINSQKQITYEQR